MEYWKEQLRRELLPHGVDATVAQHLLDGGVSLVEKAMIELSLPLEDPLIQARIYSTKHTIEAHILAGEFYA